jgi:hypothetical protein
MKRLLFIRPYAKRRPGRATAPIDACTLRLNFALGRVLVVLDDAWRPLFDELLFGRGRPTHVGFDLLVPDGVDLQPLPLRERKAAMAAP